MGESVVSMIQTHRHASAQAKVGSMQDACTQSATSTGGRQRAQDNGAEHTARKRSAEVEKLQARLAALMALDTMQAAAQRVAACAPRAKCVKFADDVSNESSACAGSDRDHGRYRAACWFTGTR